MVPTQTLRSRASHRCWDSSTWGRRWNTREFSANLCIKSNLRQYSPLINSLEYAFPEARRQPVFLQLHPYVVYVQRRGRSRRGPGRLPRVIQEKLNAVQTATFARFIHVRSFKVQQTIPSHLYIPFHPISSRPIPSHPGARAVKVIHQFGAAVG